MEHVTINAKLSLQKRDTEGVCHIQPNRAQGVQFVDVDVLLNFQIPRATYFHGPVGALSAPVHPAQLHLLAS